MQRCTCGAEQVREDITLYIRHDRISMAYAADILNKQENGSVSTIYLSQWQDVSKEEMEGWIPMMSEEQRDKQLAMMEHVQVDTLENQIIRSMIQEEASFYFAGVKSLEDTCHVIQNRVSLYLSETKH